MQNEVQMLKKHFFQYMKMAAAAASNKPLRSKVSISIVSIFIGICLGAQFNILDSLVHVNFEGKGDPYLDVPLLVKDSNLFH